MATLEAQHIQVNDLLLHRGTRCLVVEVETVDVRTHVKIVPPLADVEPLELSFGRRERVEMAEVRW